MDGAWRHDNSVRLSTNEFGSELAFEQHSKLVFAGELANLWSLRAYCAMGGSRRATRERMVTSMNIKLLFLAPLLVLASCGDRPSSPSAFTLQTGVSVQSVTPCVDGDPVQSLSLRKDGSAYLVDVATSLRCDSQTEPFVTVTHEHKATLVLDSGATSRSGFHSGCECARKLQIKIDGRLEAGDTLYVLNDYEVLGHLGVPK